jgi:hypothetical protein
MAHIVLLGDSVFDNRAYVGGSPDVARQLTSALPRGGRVTLLAADGATTRDVMGQLSALPPDATHIVVSAGGNDALMASGILGTSVSGVAEALALLADAQDGFAADYAAMVEAVLACRLPTALCTVYDTPQISQQQRVIRTALAIFNDVITRAAFSRGAALVDLRLVCAEPEDYANPIEPSARGGAKIASAILRFALGREPAASAVFQ